jgi:hypothetical protein
MATNTLSVGDPRDAAPLRSLLRLEGLAVAALAALFYARSGSSWVLFAAVWLAPDLSLLGYLAGPNWGSRIYNAIHAYVTPVTLAFCSVLFDAPILFPIALVWINHIGVDRLLGFGLKYPLSFKHTHLGVVGKKG